MLFKKKILLAKLETTYGVDSTPDGSNAIITKNLSINPYEGNRVGREIDRPTLGNDLEFNVGAYVTLSFDAELTGSGTAGTAPAYGLLLRACGFSETLIPGPDPEPRVEYQPISENFESATFYFIQGSQEHKVTGCRGTVKFNGAKGAMPSMSFTMTGIWNAPTDIGSAPTPNYTEWQTPVPVTAANTPVYQIGSYDCIAESFDLDMSTNVVYRNVIGSESVQITDRTPSGQLTIEAPDLATKDFFSAVASHDGVTTETLKVQHGTTDGAIIEFDAPVVQLSGISFSDSDGILHYQMDARLIPSDSGNDELIVTVR
jgi:hypothetical protein